jgi:hypothetical protein
VAVCTPRQQQQHQQQLQQEVEENADVGVIGNEGKHVCTFREKPHGRQPCAPYLGFVWWGKSRGIIAACILMLVTVEGNGRGVFVCCLQQYK